MDKKNQQEFKNKFLKKKLCRVFAPFFKEK